MANEYGYICKACGDVAPTGIGYTSTDQAAIERSHLTEVCACGYSVKPELAEAAEKTSIVPPNADMLEFHDAGREAHANGDMRAPAMNSVVREALIEGPVGNETNIQIMRAFTQGFDMAVEIEARAILNP